MTKDVDMLLARAQVGLAFVAVGGFIGILLLLIMYHPVMGTTEVTILTGLLGVFGTIVTLICNYFFARNRPPALPDPNSGTTVTTVPTGGSTTVTTKDPGVPANEVPPPAPPATGRSLNIPTG